MQTKSPGQHLDELLAKAKQDYDELQLKVHLADLEAKEEWEGLQERWQKFHGDCSRVIEEAKSSSVKIDDSLHAIGQEFKATFERIKDACKQS